MSLAPPLLLNREQTARLFQYMQEYRHFALTNLPPTQERNTTLRLVQSLQGKLLSLASQGMLQVHLPLTKEEASALKAMAKSLLMSYGERPNSSDRISTIIDIGKLYAFLKKTYG